MNYIKSKITIKEVAQKAGVSTQTVSRVINERPDVAPETREKINSVIDDLGYRPSALARGLIRGRSFTLGIVTAGLKYVGPSRVLNGITGAAEERGYSLLLEELPNWTASENEPVLDSLLSHRVDGIIWAVPDVGDNRAWLEKRVEGIPVPILFIAFQPRQGISSLSIDNYFGARIAVEHLIEKGHRQIAHISGPLEWWEARERKRGWQDAMQAAGLNARDCVEGIWSSSSGEAAADQLLDAAPDIEAIFSANDQMALSTLLVAHRRKLRVPEDLAVVGFDDLPESAYFFPPLTTVRQDQFSLGARAVAMLVKMIEPSREGRSIPIESMLIQPELIVRSST